VARAPLGQPVAGARGAHHTWGGPVGGANKLGEDIVVPRAAIPGMVARIKAISLKHDLPIVIFGHAGDGNLHPNILFDKRDEEEWERVEAAVADLFASAVALGGTLSGEHGVGALKLPYLEMALGPLAIEVMGSIKRALDPKGILNPGKVLPAFCC
jgi:glycolate oxidase